MGGENVNIVMNHLKDLNDLLNRYEISFMPREGKTKLIFEETDESEKSQWQNRL